MSDQIRQDASPAVAAHKRAGLDGPPRTRQTPTVAPAIQINTHKQGSSLPEGVLSASAGLVFPSAASGMADDGEGTTLGASSGAMRAGERGRVQLQGSEQEQAESQSSAPIAASGDAAPYDGLDGLD